MQTKKQIKEFEKNDAIERLRRMMDELQHKEIYTVMKHCSSSGSTRHISSYVVKDNRIFCIDYLVKRILNLELAKKGGIIVSGCGMDMGFHLVYSLSSIIYRDKNDAGYQIQQTWI